jgi:hypothetical protein
MSSSALSQRAFVLRIVPGGFDRVPEALASNEITIGWSDLPGLLEPKLLWEEFRQAVQDRYYANEPNYRRSGRDAGEL